MSENAEDQNTTDPGQVTAAQPEGSTETTPQDQDTPRAARPAGHRWTHSLAMLTLNVLMLGAIAWWLHSLAGPPCYLPLAFALCGSVALLAVFHVVLRLAGAALSEVKITIAGVSFGTKAVSTLVNLFHPSGFSSLWLVIVAAIVIFVNAAVFLTLGRVRVEDMPVVDRFSVRYISANLEKTFGLRAVVPVEPGQRVLIRAQTSCPEPRCTWTSAEGPLSKAEGCAILYTPPRQAKSDFVDVKVDTRCRTQSTSTGLFIEITHEAPQ